MKVTIDLDMQQVSEIVRTDLVYYYKTYSALEDEIELGALKKVIQMYSSPSQYDELLEWEKTRNV